MDLKIYIMKKWKFVGKYFESIHHKEKTMILDQINNLQQVNKKQFEIQ